MPLSNVESTDQSGYFNLARLSNGLPRKSYAKMPATTQFKIAANGLQEKSETPLYRQLYDLLRKQIESGRVEKNSRLPSEQELIDRLGVSRITVRRALNELAAAGLVKRQRGRGTIVTFNAAAPSVKASFENLIEGLTRIGVETVVKLIECKFVKANQALSAVMELPSGASVQRIIRLRMLDNEPFSYLITHIPEHIAQDYDEHELANASLIKLLEKSGHAPSAARQTITATAADKNVADALGVAQGAPIMCIHRIMRDRGGEVIQEITANYRADRFQYEMDLERRSDTNWAAAE